MLIWKAGIHTALGEILSVPTTTLRSSMSNVCIYRDIDAALYFTSDRHFPNDFLQDVNNCVLRHVVIK